MIRWTRSGVMPALLLVLALLQSAPVQAEPQETGMLVVKASPGSARQTVEAVSGDGTKRLRSALKHARSVPAQTRPVSDLYLTVRSNGTSTTYTVDAAGLLVDEAKGLRIEAPADLRREWVETGRRLRAAHYGELVPWSEVTKLLPLKTVMKVTDMETGQSFNVQRRAGSSHIDAQPLTREDTEIMKRIYDGTWSWRRKAVLVQFGERTLAASMNGMPHGGDGIPDNGFAGHFCIHFLGSATHGSGSVDPEHQLMSYKAAGRLEEYLGSSSPYELVNLFWLAVNRRELQIVKMSFPHAGHGQLPDFIADNRGPVAIHPQAPLSPTDASSLLALDIAAEVAMYRDGRLEERAVHTYHMRRMSVTAPWKIDFVSMIA